MVWEYLILARKKKLNLKQYAKAVKKFNRNKNTKIIFEPGRFIVGDTSVLVTKIIYIKKSTNKYFVILDSGMNDMMRPALYNATHQIVPIRKTKQIMKGDIEFVGPICESSDKFLSKRNFSKIKEGDFVGLMDVGAYGMTLSSNYNMRPTIAEIMVYGSNHKVIRKRQSLKNLIKD